MRYIKTILIFVIVLIGIHSVWGQKTDPKIEAIERHYQYLENESKAARETMQKETEAYRKFIQEERAEHQRFLERTYTIAGILITVVIFFLTFFGWNTFKGINDSKKELEAAAAGRLIAFEREMSDYKVRFGEAQQNLRQAESDYNRFLSYYGEANPRKGRYLLIGPKAKLEAMEPNELIRFEQAFGKPETESIEGFDIETFYPSSYDLIIYRSNVDEKGEDASLSRLIQKLKEFPETPIVIYATGQPEYILGETNKRLREYGLFHMATNPITLIDNVASAYRVAKMLPKSKRAI